MIKLKDYGYVEEEAVDLLLNNGASIDFDGDTGEFHSLPPTAQMSDFYGGTPGLGDTRIYRDIKFGRHVVQMGVSDGRGGQVCDRLKIVQ